MTTKRLDPERVVEIVKEVLPQDMPVVVHAQHVFREKYSTMYVMASRGNWFVTVVGDGEWCDYADVRSAARDLARKEKEEPRLENPTPGFLTVDIAESNARGAHILYRRFEGVEWDATTTAKGGKNRDLPSGDR